MPQDDLFPVTCTSAAESNDIDDFDDFEEAMAMAMEAIRNLPPSPEYPDVLFISANLATDWKEFTWEHPVGSHWTRTHGLWKVIITNQSLDRTHTPSGELMFGFLIEGRDLYLTMYGWDIVHMGDPADIPNYLDIDAGIELSFEDQGGEG